MTNAPPTPPRRRREHLGFFAVVTLLALGVVLAVVFPHFREARDIVVREDAARERLEGVRTAQLAYHERTGRYGWVDDLERAGLLPGFGVHESDGAHWVGADGYRIDVLLPHARLGAGVVAIAPQGADDRPDPDLVQRHFAVVARPLRPRVDGYRSWYVDERGEVYLNEGVVDDEGVMRNQLPKTQVLGPMGLDTASYLLWQKASEVPPTQD